MVRMLEERYARQALFSRLHGAKHSKGHPAQSFVSIVCNDLQVAGIHKGVNMSGLNGGLTSGSCPLGRAPQCPLSSNLSGLVGYKLGHKVPL